MSEEKLISLYEDDFLKITYFDKKSDDIVISFSSTPRLLQGEEVAIEQFIGTLSRNNISGIFVIDKTSSYGNKISLAKIASLISPIVKDALRVHAIGYCMGGFLAIALSKSIYLNSVVAVTPQWSIHPDVLPPQSYLNIFSSQINEWAIKDLSGYFADDTRYYILNSDDPDDQHQIKYFPKQENISIFEFGSAFGHDLPEALDGNLERLMLLCINNKGGLVTQFIEDYYKELGQSIS